MLYPHGVAGSDGKIDPELGYVQTMIDYLPASLRGLMMAGFLAAYMSTIGTHLNLGASYLTNDIYRRFMVRGQSERHYVVASRVATLIVMLLSIGGALAMHSVGDAWKYLFNLTAGVGLVMILRWYWWRVNAWSEIAALAASALVSNAIILGNVFPASDPNAQAETLLVTVPVTTVVWFAVTFLTPAEGERTLREFYRRVRPHPLGWRPIERLEPGVLQDEPLGVTVLDWLAGCGLVYATLFGIGKVVLGEVPLGLAYLAGAVLCGALIGYNATRGAGRARVPAA